MRASCSSKRPLKTMKMQGKPSAMRNLVIQILPLKSNSNLGKHCEEWQETRRKGHSVIGRSSWRTQSPSWSQPARPTKTRATAIWQQSTTISGSHSLKTTSFQRQLPNTHMRLPRKTVEGTKSCRSTIRTEVWLSTTSARWVKLSVTTDKQLNWTRATQTTTSTEVMCTCIKLGKIKSTRSTIWPTRTSTTRFSSTPPTPSYTTRKDSCSKSSPKNWSHPKTSRRRPSISTRQSYSFRRHWTVATLSSLLCSTRAWCTAEFQSIQLLLSSLPRCSCFSPEMKLSIYREALSIKTWATMNAPLSTSTKRSRLPYHRSITMPSTTSECRTWGQGNHVKHWRS